MSITQSNASIQRVVVVVHGDSRNAPDHLRYIVDAAAASGASGVLVVAPQFLIADDLTAANLASSNLYWSSSGWKQGDKSATSPLSRPWSISSFAALDMLLQKVANTTTFPNVREIDVVGHSAGGQFVDRYAAANQLEPAVAGKGIAFRYVVANPSSYLYFNANRYHSSTETFAPLSSSEQGACSSYDTYKYGLRSLNAYAGAVGASALTAQYGSRRVVYLLGLLDTSRTDSSLDQSCAAEWQGSQRLERGQTHFRYLAGVFGPGVYQNHLLRTVAGVGHDARGMYRSPDGLWALFGAIT